MRKIKIINCFLFSFLCSCNIFSPISGKPGNDDARIEEAKKHMENGEYEQAIKVCTKVITSDSSRSEAYYLRGKAELRKRGINLVSIWNEISPDNPNSVPFLYQAGDTLRNADGSARTDAVGNVLINPPLSAPAGTSTVIDSVFNELSQLHEGCKLAYLDLNRLEKRTAAGESDNVIRPVTYRLDYGIESFLTVTLELLCDFEKDGWVNSSDDKRIYELWCDPDYADFSNIDNIEIDSIKALAQDPNKINITIDSTLIRINESTMPSIDSMKAEFRSVENLDFDTTILEGFESFAVNIRDNISRYRYKDTVDNDSDFVDKNGDALQNRMIWVDYDKDGLIDISVGVFGSKDLTPGQQIGDYSHYQSYSSYYYNVKTDSLGAVAVFYHKPENSSDSIRVIHFEYYAGPRPTGGEWIRGDWGVDEELMDGKDNDCDGIIDEDTRIVEDTLDDDGDWWSTNGDTIKQIMVWKDTIVTDGKITDTDGLSFGSVAHYQAHQSEYELRLNLLGDTVRVYKGPCRGEFKAGDWGLDEEIFDGIDNDGDGLTDEDINNRLPEKPLPY